MKNTIDALEPEATFGLEAQRIDRVESFRLRKVITLEDLFEVLGYRAPEPPIEVPHPTRQAEESPTRRYLGRSWGYRAATGRRSTRACRRSLRWMR